jgi:hypothetical protein
MREGALFATMFGLGAGAVLVGVTVSRLVVGQPPERPAEEPAVLAVEESVPAVAEAVAAKAAPPAVAEAPPRPVVVEPPPAAAVAPVPAPPAAIAVPAPPPAVVSSPAPPAIVSPPTEPRAEVAPPRQQRKAVRKHRRPPAQDEAPLATASIPTDEAEPHASSAAVRHAPIAIVRGGAARPSPGVRAPGPHIIQVDPGGER